ncbi:MAG: GNAT family N-acetyltransferase, partial [Kordiimonas sp.]
MISYSLPFDKVTLRPLDALSPDLLQTWQNTPVIRDSVRGFRFPVQLESVVGWIETRRHNNGRNEAAFSIFYQESGVGACFLRDIDWVNQTAFFGIYIGAQSSQSKGVGHCASTLLLDYAFNALNLRRVALEVIATNTKAIRLY